MHKPNKSIAQCSAHYETEGTDDGTGNSDSSAKLIVSQPRNGRSREICPHLALVCGSSPPGDVPRISRPQQQAAGTSALRLLYPCSRTPSMAHGKGTWASQPCKHMLRHECVGASAKHYLSSHHLHLHSVFLSQAGNLQGCGF